ncbi:glucose-1-phosphate adenylyltransferase, partial [Escherichia coli]|nr:glucose-1-phosphate adenylyltransferase [Escherichia coli]
SLLFPFTRVEMLSELDECLVLPKVHIGPGCRIRRAIIESGCRIPANEIIGEDPELDSARFEISSEGIVLVTPEMLGQELPGVR